MDIAAVPGLRPTGERVRETLFNWLAPAIEGARCLDLFAGTGALGLEALSRGAKAVVFVERSREAAAQLRANVETLLGDRPVGAASAAKVHCMNAWDYLDRATDEPFDVVFLDPPFADAKYGELCRLLHERRLLADGALVYVEQDRDAAELLLPAGWSVARQKEAGNVRYSLLRTGHGD